MLHQDFRRLIAALDRPSQAQIEDTQAKTSDLRRRTETISEIEARTNQKCRCPNYGDFKRQKWRSQPTLSQILLLGVVVFAFSALNLAAAIFLLRSPPPCWSGRIPMRHSTEVIYRCSADISHHVGALLVRGTIAAAMVVVVLTIIGRLISKTSEWHPRQSLSAMIVYLCLVQIAFGTLVAVIHPLGHQFPAY